MRRSWLFRGGGIVGALLLSAMLGVPGDLVILISYGVFSESEAERLTPRVVFVDANTGWASGAGACRLAAAEWRSCWSMEYGEWSVDL